MEKLNLAQLICPCGKCMIVAIDEAGHFLFKSFANVAEADEELDRIGFEPLAVGRIQ